MRGESGNIQHAFEPVANLPLLPVPPGLSMREGVVPPVGPRSRLHN